VSALRKGCDHFHGARPIGLELERRGQLENLLGQVERLHTATRPPVILQLDLHDFAVLMWVHDEDGAPIYRIVCPGIKAARIAATLARRMWKEARTP
jgi:hypothetical protein